MVSKLEAREKCLQTYKKKRRSCTMTGHRLRPDRMLARRVRSFLNFGSNLAKRRREWSDVGLLAPTRRIIFCRGGTSGDWTHWLCVRWSVIYGDISTKSTRRVAVWGPDAGARQVKNYLTCLIMFSSLWELTGTDRTLAAWCQVVRVASPVVT
jgi:hypothetical protein